MTGSSDRRERDELVRRALSTDSEWRRARKAIPRARKRAIARAVWRGQGLDDPFEAASGLGLARWRRRYRWIFGILTPLAILSVGSQYSYDAAHHAAAYWRWSDLSALIVAPVLAVYFWAFHMPRVKRAEARNLAVVHQALAPLPSSTEPN